MILGHGVDVVAIDRMRKILEKDDAGHFEKRVFSTREIEYCRSRQNPYPHFAVRFAAKEAYGKAMKLGLGVSGNLAEVEVAHEEGGCPLILLSGRAKEIFEAKGGAGIHISLSHDGDVALASVILIAT